MNFKEYSLIKKILTIILTIILIPFMVLMFVLGFVLFFIVELVPRPFEKIKYKTSLFYKKYKIRYFRHVTSSIEYRFIKYLIKNNIDDINIIESNGYFSFNYMNTNYIFSNFKYITYFEDKYIINVEKGLDGITIEEYITLFLNNSKLEITNVNLLVNSKILNESQDSRIIPYSNFNDIIKTIIK